MQAQCWNQQGSLGGLSGTNWANTFSRQVGVGKKYRQEEADAYRARAKQLDMNAVDIARREFEAGRTLTDAELRGETAAGPATTSAQPPVQQEPASDYTQILTSQAQPEPEPTTAPPAATPPYVPTEATPPYVPQTTAPAPAQTNAQPAAPTPSSAQPAPLVIPITYGDGGTPGAAAPEKSIPETAADSAAAALIEDAKKNWPVYLGIFLMGVKLLRGKKR